MEQVPSARQYIQNPYNGKVTSQGLNKKPDQVKGSTSHAAL